MCGYERDLLPTVSWDQELWKGNVNTIRSASHIWNNNLTPPRRGQLLYLMPAGIGVQWGGLVQFLQSHPPSLPGARLWLFPKCWELNGECLIHLATRVLSHSLRWGLVSHVNSTENRRQKLYSPLVSQFQSVYVRSAFLRRTHASRCTSTGYQNLDWGYSLSAGLLSNHNYYSWSTRRCF